MEQTKQSEPELPEWRQELERIVKFLNRNDVESRKLWWILSALRGPDKDENYDSEELPYPTKYSTTAVIRNAIGLVPLQIAYVNCEDSTAKVDFRKSLTAQQYDEHFFDHAVSAFAVLGLDWEKLNVKEKKDGE